MEYEIFTMKSPSTDSILSNAVVHNFLTSRVWSHLNAADILLWLNLMRISSETSHHTSDAVLELTVFSGVDKGIDTDIGARWYNAQVVEPVKK